MERIELNENGCSTYTLELKSNKTNKTVHKYEVKIFPDLHQGKVLTHHQENLYNICIQHIRWKQKGDYHSYPSVSTIATISYFNDNYDHFNKCVDLISIIQNVYNHKYGSWGSLHDIHKGEVLPLFNAIDFYGVIIHGDESQKIDL